MKNITFNNCNNFYLNHEEEINSLFAEVMKSGKYIRDKQTELLEEKLKNLCNRQYAITTASCTDALYFALISAGIKSGDEVIIPTFSYIATLSAVLRAGAIPVFTDINPQTLSLKLSNIEELFSEKTKAIIFVQLFGHLIDLRSLKELCKSNDIVLIEDSAQALGVKYENFSGASFGDISCISFDPTKVVSAFGIGGAVLTDNEEYYTTITKLIHHGRNENMEFEILGYNSKISEISAAIINLQLSYLDNTISKTERLANQYVSKLAEINEIEVVLPKPGCRSTWHKFIIKAQKRDELKKYLYDNGIETKIHYSPLLHEHKLLKQFKHKQYDLTNSLEAKNEVLSLPIYSSLTSEEIDYICNTILNFYQK